MEKKLQVFVSSTYEDLKSERQAAVEAILRAHHIPAGMELFSAGNLSQLEKIKQWIKDSDLFLLILGGRYGSIEPNSGKSYIQLEYEYAVEKRKPLFAVILRDGFLDAKAQKLGVQGLRKIHEVKHRDKYEAFKAQVLLKICRFCDSEGDIRTEIPIAINDIQREYDLSGYVPGIELRKQYSIMEEQLEGLKRENEHLRKELKRCHHLNIFEKCGLESAFRIKIENNKRDVRVKQLVKEEMALPGEKKFRLLASSGGNYLKAEGKVWQAGLGEAITNSLAKFTVILESPFSSFALTRALANKLKHHHWVDKISVEYLLHLMQYKNLEIRVTEQTVNCSLFFTRNAVFYDPYLWALRSEAGRTENNFWVLEFRNQETTDKTPDPDYECYNLLEKHFDFLLKHSISLKDFLGEDNKIYHENNKKFQQTLAEIKKNYG